MILEGEIKDAKLSSFHLISKDSLSIYISFVFSLWIISEKSRSLVSIIDCSVEVFYRPFPSCLKSQFQSEDKCKAIDIRIISSAHAD